MQRNGLQWVVCACVGLCLFGGGASAQDPKKDKWWERTAPSYDPIPLEWLLHADGTFGLQVLEGNKEGIEYEGNGLFVVRKERWSDYLWLMRERVDTESTTGDSTDNDEIVAIEEVHYDFSKPLYLIGGAIYYRNSKVLIEDFSMAYGGVGLFLEPASRLRVNAELGTGPVMQEYQEGEYVDPYVQEGLVDERIDTWGWYALLRANVAMTQWAAATLQARYMETPTKELQMRWVTSLTLDFMLTEHFGVQVGYKIGQEDNELLEVSGLEKTDSKTMVGLKLSY